MTVEWLIKELKKAPNKKAEVILVVEDDEFEDISGGILSHILREGEGAENGQCELYAKG